MSPSPSLCVVGLGYVGLPLAHAFAEKGYRVIGVDVNEKRIEELQRFHDRNLDLTEEELRAGPMELTTDPLRIKDADVVFVVMPTPVDERNVPDLTLLEAASRTVGQHLKRGAIVVYESTVYPGVTEEICGPILEQASGMTCGTDFTLGYSPERINPGDRQHTIKSILKVVAGQDERTTDVLVELYGSIVAAGIHRAPSIKVAEMAKAIENAQRDLNIAYVNEVAMLCNALDIRTKDVLDAAGTKWNFLKFQPGLVGGHCIGVDPYYLVEKARQLGMETRVITAGRSVNDGIAAHVAHRVSEHLPVPPGAARVLVLGVTFKEDCPDMRNSKVADVIKALQTRGTQVEVHDPFYTPDELAAQGHTPGSLERGPYDAVLYLVPHRSYRDLPLSTMLSALPPGGLLFDLKSILDPSSIIAAGRSYSSL